MRSLTDVRAALAVLVVAASLALFPPAVFAGSLVGRWSLDTAPGGNTTPDDSGNGLTGTGLTGTVGAGGRFANALTIATPGQGFRVVADPRLQPEQLTVVTWAKKNGGTNTYRQLVELGGEGCAKASYGFSTGPDGGIRFSVYVATPSGPQFVPVDNSVPPASIWNNAWHAIAGTYDGATLRLYVDGAMTGSVPAPAGTTGVQYGLLDQRLAVGKYAQDSDPNVGNCDPNGFGFLGSLDDVRIYSRALGAGEVATLQDGNATTPPDIADPPDTPAPTPTPTPTPGPALPPDATIARLAAPAATKRLATTTLDGSLSSGLVAKYLWDVNDDGVTDAECGPEQPKITVRNLGTTETPVKLTTVGQLGSTSVAKTFVGVKSVKGRGARAAAPTVLTGLSRNLAGATLCQALKPKVDVTLLGGPPAGCSSTLNYGIVSVTGCLDRITAPENIPPKERATLDELVRQWNASPPARAFEKQVCLGGTCSAKPREAMITATDFYVSKFKTVRVNGLDIQPLGGASVIVHAQLGRIISSNAMVRLGNAILSSGPLNLDVSGRSGSKVALGHFDSVKNLPPLGGFAPTGTVDVALAADGASGNNGDIAGQVVTAWGTPVFSNRRTEVTLALRMPEIFSVFGGPPPTVTTVASATNERGFEIDSLNARVEQINIGAARLTDVSFDYLKSDPKCGGKSSWRGGGNLFFGPASDTPDRDAGLLFTPPPDDRGIGFCGDSLSYAGGTFNFGAPGPPEPQVFPGVSLNSIGFGVGFHPFRFDGTVRLTAARTTEVTGAVLVAFASPEEPYTVKAPKGNPLNKFDGQKLSRTTIAAGGNVSLKVPVLGQIPLGNGYFMYGVPNYIHAGGTMRVDIPGGHVSGEADGEIDFGSGRFNLSVQGEACTLFCYGAAVRVSSVGIVACGKLKVATPFGDITWSPGLGWHYDSIIPTIYLAGCDIDDFKAKVAAAGADGSRTFTVPKGITRAEVRLVGAGGAPNVEVKGPDGETVTTAANPLSINKTLRLFRQDETGRTWIGVENAKPGEYTITPLAGSARITEVATANGVPPAKIKATDGGSGDNRTLAYDVSSRPRQEVTFIERGGTSEQVLGTVKSGSGTLKFAPDEGTPGTRKIVARITVDGLVTEERPVATFTAGKPPKPGKPSGVKVSHKGTSLAVSWGSAASAESYAVVVTPAGGAQKAVEVSAKRRSAKITGILATLGGTVSVHALAAGGDAGPVATVRFRATKKAPTRFRPFKELQSKKKA